MSLTIRAIEDSDVENVVALWATCDLVVAWNDPYDDIECARRSSDAEILVGIEEDGSLAASTMVGHDGHRGWIYYVAVTPGRQGSGYGRQIIQVAEDWLRDAAVPKMQLMIREANTAVRDFYLRLGYAEEERLVMSKRLDPRPAVGETRVPITVNYLEMTTRPTRPTVASPAGRKLSLMRIERPSIAFYRFLYDAVGRDWCWVERRLLSDDELACVLASESTEIYVLYDGGAPAGFCDLTRGLGERRDEVEISYFGLLPESIGRGLGWYFINAAIDIAWSREPARVTLNTCDLDHPRALPNYQRAGFSVIGREERELPDPRRSGLPLPQRVVT